MRKWRALKLAVLALPLAWSYPLQGAAQEDLFTSLLHRGFAFHQQADYGHALPLLRQALGLNPHDYFVNLLLGIDELRTGHPGEAIPFLQEASRLRPKEDFPYEYSGEALAQLGRYDQAAISYLKAVNVSINSAEANEGWVDFILERFRQLAGQLRSSQAGLAAEYRLQARSYPAADSRRRALLQQSASIDAHAPGIWSELALADSASGDLAGAQKDKAQALAQNALDPQAAEAKPSLSAKLFQAQRWDRLAALPEPPQSAAELWFERGVAFAQTNRCEAAIPALERALERTSPGHLTAGLEIVYARFLLSWCYADEAGKVDARIRQSGGDLAIAHMIRGDVLLRLQGDPSAAIAEYQAALLERRTDPRLLERLAEAQTAAGDYPTAAENARTALQLDAHGYAARQTLARIAIDQGKYDEALPLLTALAAEDPNDEGTQISLATALSQTGNSAEALLHLQPVLASGYPDQKGSLHFLLGALLRKVGRTAEAGKAFATARELSETYQQSSHRDQEESR